MKRSILAIFVSILMVVFITSCNTAENKSGQGTGQQVSEVSDEAVMPILEKSMKLLNAGNSDEALKLLKKAQKMAPEKYLVNVLLGNVYFNRKEYKKSLEALEKAVKINPDEPTPYFLIGCCYYNFAEYTKAEENLLKYLETNKDASAMMLLGLSYAREKKKDQAIASLNKAKEMDPVLAGQIDSLIQLIKQDDYEKFLKYVNDLEKNQ